MPSYTYRFAPVVLAALLLVGCSSPAPLSETPLRESSAPAGGTIELAVSETCADGSAPECVPVGSQLIVSPTTFQRAQVANAVVAEDQQNAVEVTFTDDGAAIFGALTRQAAEAGSDSRLIIKIDDTMLSAVTVMEPLTGDEVVIALSPDDDAHGIADSLNGD